MFYPITSTEHKPSEHPRSYQVASRTRQPSAILNTGSISKPGEHFSVSPPRDTPPPVMKIVAKNLRGLKTEERLHELLMEIQATGENWDILILNETWRKDGFEMFSTSEGHVFANSGCEEQRRGVGFLIHRRWVKYLKSFQPINERVAFITIQKHKLKMRIVAVYFPHTGYPDEPVQTMYDVLTSLVHESRARKEQVIIGGDFNAEIGARSEVDNQNYIGSWSIGQQNYRGFWLKRWCELEEVFVANTFYPKTNENTVTYVGPNQHGRQIDYFLVCRRTKRLMRNAGSVADIDMGSDHRAIELVMEIGTNKRRNQRGKPLTGDRTKRVAWKHVCTEKYPSQVSDLFTESQTPANTEKRCEFIEATLLEACRLSEKLEETEDMSEGVDETLRELIERRRAMKTSTNEKSAISKQIQKHVRKSRRQIQHQKVEETLRLFRNLRRIPAFKTVQKKKLIVQMKDKNGNQQYSRRVIADIFADFYEQLYSSTQETEQSEGTASVPVDPFTRAELVSAIKSLKSNRCQDTAGIKAEMLKTGGEVLVGVLLDLYNQILCGEMQAPKAWKHSVISVIYKSGDATLPQNYRPICIIPLLYKLFSTLLYKRIYPILDAEQCKDQAGFRSRYSTVDHMFVFTMLQEKSEEFSLNSWVAAIDFKKAFDTIRQGYLWDALKEQNLPGEYINVLKNLYADQTAQVKTDILSRTFHIYRGTKQGDPLSSLLFNALLERVMSKAKCKFLEKKYGIQLGATDETRLTNLRFADDVLLTGRSLKQVCEMLHIVQVETQECGLELHPDKTKIISSTNRENRPRNKFVQVGDMKIEVLGRAFTIKYLGRQITFEEPHTKELSNRIKCAWAKFVQHKEELTKKQYSLADRLRLFESIVSPAVLYGSETWTLTKEMAKLLRTTQRRMLRKILGQGRRRIHRIPETANDPETAESEEAGAEEGEEDPGREENDKDDLEPWVDWIKRVTHSAESSLETLKIKTWVEQARRRKWKWAAKLLSEPGERRWSQIILDWSPQIHFDAPKPSARRKPGRQNMRWADELKNYVKNHTPGKQWNEVCSDPVFWISYEDHYVNSCN